MTTTFKTKTKAIIGSTAGIISSLALASQANAQGVFQAPGGFGNVFSLSGNNLGKYVGEAVQFILIIATIIALFFLIWGGVRWILSGGDKSKVEEARKTIIGAIVGLVITFLAYFILTTVLSLFGIGGLNSLSLPKLG